MSSIVTVAYLDEDDLDLISSVSQGLHRASQWVHTDMEPCLSLVRLREYGRGKDVPRDIIRAGGAAATLAEERLISAADHEPRAWRASELAAYAVAAQELHRRLTHTLSAFPEERT